MAFEELLKPNEQPDEQPAGGEADLTGDLRDETERTAEEPTTPDGVISQAEARKLYGGVQHSRSATDVGGYHGA